MFKDFRRHYSSIFAAPIFLGLLLVVSESQAQASLDSLNFIQVTAEMSQSSATEIFEDSKGFLWVGTVKGLNRYDGSDFEVFEQSSNGITGLTDGGIEKIYEDADGHLFIGTNKGFNIYDEQMGIVRPYSFKPDGLKIQNEHITTIIKIGNFFWLGTAENGLYRYNIVTGETSHLNLENLGRNNQSFDNRIVEVFQLSDKQMMVITKASSFLIDNQLNIKEQLINGHLTTSALQVGASTILLGTENGDLLEYDFNNQKLTHQETTKICPGNTVLAIEQDAYGNIWLGTENDGLSIYSLTTGKFSNTKTDSRRPNSIPNNSIWSLCKTRDGVMWVGNFKMGLSFYDPNFYKFRKVSSNPFSTNSLNNNIVNCFHEAKDGSLWVGTDGGGLNHWNKENDKFTHFSKDNNKLNSNVILAIEQVSDEMLWLGTWGKGISLFNSKTKDYEVWNSANSFLASDYVLDILKDSKGRIWIAEFWGGLQIYYSETGKYENVAIGSEIYSDKIVGVARLLEANDGTIWIGTLTMGAFRLTENNGSWTSEQYHNSSKTNFLSDNSVNTIVQDDYENIWIGTQSGLNKFVPSKNTFETITKADGLVSDAVRGIVQDEYGNLWLSTDKGVTRYDEEKNEFLDYDIYDGLQGKEFNAASAFRTSKFEILFGGTNGFNMFTSKHTAKRTDEPEVLFSSLKIFNKPVYPNDNFGVLEANISQVDSLTLSYKHSVFNIEFKALTLKANEKVKYAYFLEGFENDWNYIGNKTSATYTNLDPGEYIFHVKSTNSDGVWNDIERLLHITISPPFWKTWWFQLIVASLILGAVYLVYYIRVRNIKAYQVKLEKKIDERTRELRQQQDKLIKAADELSSKNEDIQRFTYSLSHDLKSPLNGIKGITELISLDAAVKDIPDLEKHLNMIGISCDTMSTLIEDITEMAKMGKIENNYEFLDANEIIALAKNLVIGKLEVHEVELTISDNLPEIYGDKNRMIQVFGNLLDNAIKYMGDQTNPTIEVKAEKIEDTVQFEVSDNGSGMDEKSLKKLFSPFERFHANVKGTGLGLYMIKQIVESHSGQIRAESPGKEMGTSFFVTLPNAQVSSKNHYEQASTLETVTI
jgi:signal transduction histidine kinase/ligand-binding sensor domain-containing protein